MPEQSRLRVGREKVLGEGSERQKSQTASSGLKVEDKNKLSGTEIKGKGREGMGTGYQIYVI